MSNNGTSSQTQTLPACLRSTSTSCKRTGSPSALATDAMRTACSRSTSGYTTGSQHGSPAGRLIFGVSSRSMAIYSFLAIEATVVNRISFRSCAFSIPGLERRTPPLSCALNPRSESSMSHVLFVCLHNAGRSQMSQALFERVAERRHTAESAGSVADPNGHVHAEVVEVMGELGVDLSDRRPQPLTRELAERADVVVTMGCGDACPYIPGKRYIDWDLTDPKGRPVAEVRATRDQIAQRVDALLAELGAA